MTRAIGDDHPASGPFSPVGEADWHRGTWLLGARRRLDASCEFAVFSGNAEKIVLELYSAALGQNAAWDYTLARGADGLWRAQVAGVPSGTLYGLRASGPIWRFDRAWRQLLGRLREGRRRARQPLRPEQAPLRPTPASNVSWGAGPRASQYLVIGAKARAILAGRFAASVEDVKALARPVLRHRVLPNFTAESEGMTSVKLIDLILERVTA